MNQGRFVEWALRIGLFGTFVGHGVFALQGKASWITWISAFTSWDAALATQALFVIGILDIVVGFIILIKPIRIVLLWAIFWTSWTAVMRVLPFIGDPVWELVERIINPASAIALLYLVGLPSRISSLKEWFK
jgi:hypothetical protein